MLVGGNADLRLLNSAHSLHRIDALPQPATRTLKNRLIRTWIFRRFGPHILWSVAEVVLSVAGAAIPILGILRI